MAYREYRERIGGINHWLFAQDDFRHIISRPFRGEDYNAVINGSGIVKGEQIYPKGYQEMIIPELKLRAEFFREEPLARKARGFFLISVAEFTGVRGSSFSRQSHLKVGTPTRI